MNAIEQGIITPTTKARLLELENEQDSLQMSIADEKAERPMISRDHIIFWLESFRKGDPSSPTYRQNLIDTFIHSIYLYDDEIRIAFNFSDKNNTVTYPFINNPPSTDLPERGALAPPPCSDYVRLSPPNFFEKKFGSKSFIFYEDVLIQMDSRFFYAQVHFCFKHFDFVFIGRCNNLYRCKEVQYLASIAVPSA